MASVGKYLRNESSFKEDAYAVLQSRFMDRSAFEDFYTNALRTPEARNQFLKVCCSHRFLAKHGDWKIAVPKYDEIIEYYTNSYKLVAIFSIVESLSALGHQDFYEWLTSPETAAVFPIESLPKLRELYWQYKESYGSIRRCVVFFGRLTDEQQTALCRCIQIDGKPMPNIKKLAEYLYLLRSKFVHEGELVLEIGSGPIYSVGKKGLLKSTLTMAGVFDAFEYGLLAHFRHGT